MIKNARIQYRKTKSNAFQVLIFVLAFIITLPLIAIIFYIFKEGVTNINWHFLTNVPKPVGEIGGGIANALLGSVLIVATASVIAVPIGIMCGIYLSENSLISISIGIKNSNYKYYEDQQ